MIFLFRFYVPANIVYGRGTSSQIGEEVSKLGKKAFIVTGKSSAKTGLLEKALGCLDDEHVEYEVFDKISANPLTTTVEEGASLLKETGCDCILAMGGGSPIDAAKGIALLAANGGDINDYIFKRVTGNFSAVPIVAVPTTCGTGTESNGTAVLSNPVTKDKKGLSYPCLIPKCSIVDPALMETMPKSVVGPVTFDTMCHSMESFLSPGSNAFSEPLALSSLERLSKYLVRINDDIHDEEAVDNITLASTVAGASFYSAGLIAPHGMEHPLSGLRNIAHGRGLAALTPVIYDHSFEGCPERFARISKMFGGTSAEDCGDTVRKVLSDIDMRIGLEKEGFTDEDVPWLAENCLKVSKLRIELNPKVFDKAEIEQIYREAM